jgi:hypothetical protein
MNICKNCGAEVPEKFCGRCGEKVYTDADKSFKHLFEEAFHFMTHFEGKFFTTLLTMIKKPGKLSADFCAGIRRKYFKPLSFYLLLIIAYLLFPVFEGLNMKMKFYTQNRIYGAYAERKIAEVQAKRGYDDEKMAEAFHYKGEKTSKFMLFTILPFMALLSLTFGFWKRRYYYDHFIFATEATSFLILYGFLFLPLVIVLFSLAGVRLFSNEDILAFVLYTGVSVYASVAAGNFFHFKKVVNIVYGLIFSLGLVFFIQYVYKFLLFYVIIHLV